MLPRAVLHTIQNRLVTISQQNLGRWPVAQPRLHAVVVDLIGIHARRSGRFRPNLQHFIHHRPAKSLCGLGRLSCDLSNARRDAICFGRIDKTKRRFSLRTYPHSLHEQLRHLGAPRREDLANQRLRSIPVSRVAEKLTDIPVADDGVLLDRDPLCLVVEFLDFRVVGQRRIVLFPQTIPNDAEQPDARCKFGVVLLLLLHAAHHGRQPPLRFDSRFEWNLHATLRRHLAHQRPYSILLISGQRPHVAQLQCAHGFIEAQRMRAHLLRALQVARIDGRNSQFLLCGNHGLCGVHDGRTDRS